MKNKYRLVKEKSYNNNSLQRWENKEKRWTFEMFLSPLASDEEIEKQINRIEEELNVPEIIVIKEFN